VLNQQSFENVLLGAATDYSGLDLNLYAFADPSFEIDPSFVLPEGVSIDIQRITNVAPVPLPASGWLLVSGFAALGALRRRRSRR
jgi:hypothetical protein